MRTLAIVQARMGSTRLPGKIMMDLSGKPVLQHVIERLRRARQLDDIVIATSTLASDDLVADFCTAAGVLCFRGSESDVLSRYFHAAEAYAAEVVVRITSDCPLIDPAVVDAIVLAFKNGGWDLSTNAGPYPEKRTFPRGLDTEVFSYQGLKAAHLAADQPYQREHVTPYLYEHATRIYHHLNATDCSGYRWTLDTPEDYAFISAVYKHLYTEDATFGFPEIMALMQAYPELQRINAHIEQKEVK